MKKILLLHGWDYDNYTSRTEKTDAWHNREKFVKELQKHYEIYKLNFPGFCGQKEPSHAWNINDYAQYVSDYLIKNNLTIDYILGYSFGGAVALTYNLNHNNNQKLILISPAIIRNFGKSKKFIKTPKLLTPIRNKLRDLYVIYILKTEEMKYGTKFLRQSYQNIVRIELLDSLTKIKPEILNIIYGSNDDMVNPNHVIESVQYNYKKCIKVIEDGNHDIANTHTEKLVKIINKITND